MKLCLPSPFVGSERQLQAAAAAASAVWLLHVVGLPASTTAYYCNSTRVLVLGYSSSIAIPRYTSTYTCNVYMYHQSRVDQNKIDQPKGE